MLRSGRLSLGPTIDRFEEAFAEVVGAPYAAAVSSGTAGLHLLCITAGVGPGDEVVTSPYSFVASANCAIYEGATPVFADVDPRTLNLTPAAVEAAITERTRAVVAVDIYGYPCELDELREVCDAHGVALIQDACEALGARYKGAPRGLARSVGGVRLLSEQADHDRRGRHGHDALRVRVAGCSGACATRDAPTPAAGSSTHASVSTTGSTTSGRRSASASSRSSTTSSARRGAVAARYAELLADVPGLELPCADDADHERSWFVYVVTLPEDADREAVIATLADRGVQTARYLPCIHLQPYMQERFGYRVGLCPVAERLASRTLALPFHARLAEEDQAYVGDALRSALG